MMFVVRLANKCLHHGEFGSEYWKKRNATLSCIPLEQEICRLQTQLFSYTDS